jgi:hypothetical protein
MAVYKKVNLGDWVVDVPNGNISFTTGTLTLDGSLVVTGNITNTLNKNEPTLVLNANLTANDSPYSGNSGIIVNRGSGSNVSIFWEEIGSFANSWTLTDAGGNVGYIQTSYLPLKLEETTNSPVGEAGYVVITANTSETGSSGLFVNSGGVTGELTTTLSAKKYAIIFG